MNPSVFTAKTAQVVCGVSHRQLIHWISRDIVQPAKCYRKKHQPKRLTYLFDYVSLVQIRVARYLRQAGVPLRKIEWAIQHLRARGLRHWEQEWLLVSPSGDIILAGQNDVEVLSGKHFGQFVFAAVALPVVSREVSAGLETAIPFEAPVTGEIIPYTECLP